MQKTILIIEDNELNMKLFNDVLEASGYKTLKSIDGMDCMQLAKEQHPDLIIMDIQLPFVSGIEHTHDLKADVEVKNIPVLAVTAHAMDGDEEAFLEEGFDGYLAKPINVSAFLETVARFAA